MAVACTWWLFISFWIFLTLWYLIVSKDYDCSIVLLWRCWWRNLELLDSAHNLMLDQRRSWRFKATRHSNILTRRFAMLRLRLKFLERHLQMVSIHTRISIELKGIWTTNIAIFLKDSWWSWFHSWGLR